MRILTLVLDRSQEETFHCEYCDEDMPIDKFGGQIQDCHISRIMNDACVECYERENSEDYRGLRQTVTAADSYPCPGQISAGSDTRTHPVPEGKRSASAQR